jgi:hypothetical protein
MRFGVERDLTLCGHLNGDIGNHCRVPNFRNKSCLLCMLILIYLLFLLKFVLVLILT